MISWEESLVDLWNSAKRASEPRRASSGKGAAA